MSNCCNCGEYLTHDPESAIAQGAIDCVANHLVGPTPKRVVMSPDRVEECVESVLEDNPELDEDAAYGICKDMDLEDGCPTVSLEDCPDGQVSINGECVAIETVESVPPSRLSAPRVLATRELAGPITREERDDDTVVYRDMALLDFGTWTDAASGQPTLYDPAELEVVEDNSVNIMHDSESESSEAGHIMADSYYVEGETGYADIVLDVSTSAGQYADENLQEALESGGKVGFGGPSIEIPEHGYDLERTTSGVPKLVDGEIHGLAFVRQPASKSTSFARQTAQRGVAMSDGSDQTPKVYTPERGDMSDEIRQAVLARELQAGDIQDDAENIADELDVPVADVMEVLDPLLDDEEGEEMADDEDDEEGEQEMQEDEEEEEEEEQEMQEDGAIDALQEQIDDLWGEIETLKESMLAGEELEEAKADLADAETVQELSATVEELDERARKLEAEPKNPKSLSDGDGEGERVPAGRVSMIDDGR